MCVGQGNREDKLGRTRNIFELLFNVVYVLVLRLKSVEMIVMIIGYSYLNLACIAAYTTNVTKMLRDIQARKGNAFVQHL